MTAVVTDANYRMTLSLTRDLADRGIDVVACYAGDRVPFPAKSKSVRRAVQLPDARTEPEAFLDALYKTCEEVCREEGQKPALIPGGTRATELLCPAAVRQRFSEVCGLALASEESLEIANNKATLMALCEKLGIAHPKTEHPSCREDFEGYTYPLIVKPVCGEKQGLKAGERYVIAHDPKTAADAWVHFSQLCGETVVQAYLRGKECGFSAITRDGEILTTTSETAIRMLPISGGPGTFYYTGTGEVYRPIAEQLVRELNFSGIIMFQFILTEDGKPYLMEINPRVWGYYPIVREAKSSFTYDWFAVSLGLEPLRENARPGVYQYFLPSDAGRALQILKKGKVLEALGHIGTWLRPRNHEALFEWSDWKASWGYLSYYLKRSGEL